MPIFPVLETEDRIQINDKTRLDGSKSFVSGTTAITIREIKPGASASFITLDTTNQYLDWMFSFTVDVGTTNNKLNFKESGPELTATLATGNYTLAALATQIQTQLNSVSSGYTVSLSDTDRFTISRSSGFSLLIHSGTNANASIYSHIGFTGADKSGASSYAGAIVESAIKTVSLKVTNGSGDETITKDIAVFSVNGDKLYSTDSRLKEQEPEIMRYVKPGRATFKDVHRRTQELILAWLDKEGHIDIFGNKYTKQSLVLVDELTEWATNMTLKLIHEGRSNATDDIFHEKANRYRELEKYYRERAVLRLDQDGDGVASQFEQTDIRSGTVFRR